MNNDSSFYGPAVSRRPAVPTVPSPPRRGSPAGFHGYRASSDELNAGLEISALPFNTLPVDVVSELLRLRRTWIAGSNPNN